MGSERQPKRPWRSAGIGAAICVLAGLALRIFPVGDWLTHWSYDLAAILRPSSIPSEAIVVYMDEKSFSELGQKPGNWNRKLHAGLIDRLTRDQARLVVFDVTLRDPAPPDANAQLSRAMRDNDRMVLAAFFAREENTDAFVRTVEHPPKEFEDAAKHWGVSEVDIEQTPVVRRYFQGDEREPSLPWVAARLAGSAAAREGADNAVERWLNYYGPPGTLRRVSFSEAASQPPGHYKDCFVFIGSWREAYYAHDRTDEFDIPHTRASRGKMSGVEITATAFLNLLRNEWWTRLSRWKEQWLIVAAGLLSGFGLRFFRPGVACALAVVAMLLIAALAIMLTWQTRVWSAWMIPVGAQIPLAVGWSCLAYTRRLRREKESLEEELTKGAGQRAVAPIPDHGAPTPVPDHVLLRRVGEGGYGEVWLARNAVGILHAVKIVHRRAFTSDVPYEREFKGIERFMPVSRSHPGLVQILHVGRHDAAGCFYYVMELADEDGGEGEQGRKGEEGIRTSAPSPPFSPANYQARTLASVLTRRGALPVAECARLGVALAGALEHLHQKQLIHRDIKPANIIFVEGAPKLADIGLVTTMSGSRDDTVSQVGTEGYAAPEGPGTAAADVYSLGKVLYEACMGQDRRKFPELPTAVYEAADYQQRMALNEIIVKACATRVEERYRTAGELREALTKLAEA